MDALFPGPGLDRIVVSTPLDRPVDIPGAPVRLMAHRMTGDPCNHDWSVVQRYDHRFQAEQAQQLLETSGVSTMIQGDDASGWAPHIGFGTGGISVLVPAADVPKALRILGETDAP